MPATANKFRVKEIIFPDVFCSEPLENVRNRREPHRIGFDISNFAENFPDSRECRSETLTIALGAQPLFRAELDKKSKKLDTWRPLLVLCDLRHGLACTASRIGRFRIVQRHAFGLLAECVGDGARCEAKLARACCHGVPQAVNRQPLLDQLPTFKRAQQLEHRDAKAVFGPWLAAGIYQQGYGVMGEEGVQRLGHLLGNSAGDNAAAFA